LTSTSRYVEWSIEKLTDDRLGEKSEDIRARVEKAAEAQRQRFAGTSLICNADMGAAEVQVPST